MPIFSNSAAWWGSATFEYVSDALIFVSFVIGCYSIAWRVFGRVVGRVVVGVTRRDLAVFSMFQVVLFAVWLCMFKWVVLWDKRTHYSLQHGWTQGYVKVSGVIALAVCFFGLLALVWRARGYVLKGGAS